MKLPRLSISLSQDPHLKLASHSVHATELGPDVRLPALLVGPVLAEPAAGWEESRKEVLARCKLRGEFVHDMFSWRPALPAEARMNSVQTPR